MRPLRESLINNDRIVDINERTFKRNNVDYSAAVHSCELLRRTEWTLVITFVTTKGRSKVNEIK
ncbi:MAG: hypothetical protein ACTS42_01890 [Candidatus Hodgkinia cicadicola]